MPKFQTGLEVSHKFVSRPWLAASARPSPVPECCQGLEPVVADAAMSHAAVEAGNLGETSSCPNFYEKFARQGPPLVDS